MPGIVDQKWVARDLAIPSETAIRTTGTPADGGLSLEFVRYESTRRLRVRYGTRVEGKTVT